LESALTHAGDHLLYVKEDVSMSAEAQSQPGDGAGGHASHVEQLRLASEVLTAEAMAIRELARNIPASFPSALKLLQHTAGNVIVTGMGKAGLIGQKLAATLSSTGTPSHFLHPAEAVHGDLGGVQQGDIVLALSYSGETEEILRMLPTLRNIPVPIISITSRESSSLGRQSSVTLPLGDLEEACPLGLAPTTTTAVMLALGDALALVLSQLKGFCQEDFARCHPAGNLGRRLARVSEVMRPLDQCRVALETQSVRQVFVEASIPGRRSGAIMLVDEGGRLTGIFTDSDLVKLLEQKQESILDNQVVGVMTREPITVDVEMLMNEAVEILATRRISELPVVDRSGQPCGMLDITDAIEWCPRPASPAAGAITGRHAGAPGTLPFRHS
jgi:arabinose-5-phosphate isomerase